MGRVFLAFRCFFAILFHGRISEQSAERLGLMPRAAAQPPAPPPRPAAPAADHVDGAVAMLAILQRDSRLIDFLMEDISAYDDEQIGAAVRTLHDQCRDSLGHYVRLAPVIDGVEGTVTNLAGTPAATNSSLVKFVGNVPAEPPKSGVLRHKGWRAEKIELPVPPHRSQVVAPAEIEIE